jgi:16S rRNA (guanine(527)-N(7))-methyltransferase RsmG
MSPEAESPLAPEGYARLLRALCPAFSLELAAPAVAGLASYLAELDVWRRRINLTGNLSAEELASHALESVLGAGLIAHGERVVDIGSGAGFPGLPLAIARPDLSVTLVEPRGKRCAFLRHVARSLSLENLRVIEGRIEKVGGQTFDVATSRAVGGLPALLADPRFLDTRGSLLAWTTEPDALATSLGPGFSLETTVAVPGSSRRRIACYRRL